MVVFGNRIQHPGPDDPHRSSSCQRNNGFGRCRWDPAANVAMYVRNPSGRLQAPPRGFAAVLVLSTMRRLASTETNRRRPSSRCVVTLFSTKCFTILRRLLGWMKNDQQTSGTGHPRWFQENSFRFATLIFAESIFPDMLTIANVCSSGTGPNHGCSNLCLGMWNQRNRLHSPGWSWAA